MDGVAFDRYVITFTKTPDTLCALPLAQQQFPQAVLIPVPSQISKSCGLAIELPVWQPEEQRRFFEELPVAAYLYHLRMERDEQGTNRIQTAFLEAEKGPA